MKVQLSAQLLKVESKSDRTYKLTFNTQELEGGEASKLLTLLMNQGWLLFSPEELTEADIPSEKPNPMLGSKTSAQRLRGTLYRLWEQAGKQGEFEQYYRTVMERYIDQVKEKLE